ncbi:MAG: hypothetical protein NOU37_03685 [Candidatus Brocadiales bacterium]|nr:hypothetical protein [Candidatus Bathyanammoxibius amoris]
MRNKNFEAKKVAIKDLTLWDANSRFPDYLQDGNEGELIKVLLERYDIAALANEIVEEFYLPQLEKLVVWKTRDKNVVLEGNRRVAAYKCLINPNLVREDNLRGEFEALKNKIPISEEFQLESVVTSNKEEGMRYVKRKHYHGNNEKRWEHYERDHYIKRTRGESEDKLSPKERKSIFRARLGEKIELLDFPRKIKQEILGRGFTTIFYRVVDSAQGRKKLKYEKKDDYGLYIDNEKEFLSLLKVIVYNIFHKKTLSGEPLNTRTLNKDTEIQKYLNSISITDAKVIDGLIKIARENPPKAKEAPKISVRKTKIVEQGSFSSLINPRKALPRIKSEKIKEVFRELQEVNVTKCPTASTLLVRTLIEITIDEYLKKKGDSRKDGKPLVSRINHVRDKYIKDEDLKDTVVLLNNELLTKNLNQVVHNTVFSATGTTIKDLWKNLSKFFGFLVNDPKMKK